jgi:hypothetical protein
LREILKIGAVSDSGKCDIIRLIRFWAKNEGKNEHFFALFCNKCARFEQKLTKIGTF